MAREALGWLDGLKAELRDSPEVRTAHAALAAAARDWKRLQALVQDGAWGAVPADAVTLAFAAHVQREGVGVAHARATWDDALSLARTQPAQQALLRLAETWIWPEATKAALWLTARSFPTDTSAWRALLAGAETEGDSAEAWEVARAWAAERPADADAQARAQWLAVLLNKPDNGLNDAARAALGSPLAAPESRAAAALLRLRAGQAAAALVELRQREAGLAAAPRAALVYGRLLAGPARAAESERWLALAAAAKLLPEERALLEQARALNTASRPATP